MNRRKERKKTQNTELSFPFAPSCASCGQSPALTNDLRLFYPALVVARRASRNLGA
jgi:hypothetical protein